MGKVARAAPCIAQATAFSLKVPVWQVQCHGVDIRSTTSASTGTLTPPGVPDFVSRVVSISSRAVAVSWVSHEELRRPQARSLTITSHCESEHIPKGSNVLRASPACSLSFSDSIETTFVSVMVLLLFVLLIRTHLNLVSAKPPNLPLRYIRAKSHPSTLTFLACSNCGWDIRKSQRCIGEPEK